MADYDAIVVGAGHNGLAAAITLAKEGLKVLCLEKNTYVGGIAATTEFFKGFKHDVGAATIFPLSERLVGDLELRKYGLEFVDAPTRSCSIGGPGEAPLIWYADETKMMEHLRDDHGEDALQGLAGLFEFCRTPSHAMDRFNPLSPPKSFGAIINAAPSIQAKDAMRRCFLGSCMDLINEFFPDPSRHRLIRGTLAYLGVNSAGYMGPSTPGSALGLVYSVATNGAGQFMRHIKGGMGRLMEGLQRSFEEKGGETRLGTPVKRILIEKGKAVGVELEKGEKITAKVVLSNLDAYATFVRLVGENNLPSDFVIMVKRIDNRCPYVQILVTLKELPEFAGDFAFANDDSLRWAMGIFPSPEDVERCWDACKSGRIPEDPVLGYQIASVWDDSLAPPGYHAGSIFVPYFPVTAPRDQLHQLRDEMADKAIDKMNKYAPNFRAAIMDKAVLSPQWYENVFGCTNGDFTHGVIRPDQMFDFRPVVGWSGYKTPVGNLYLCSSACYPGPGVTFIPGYNSAHEVLKNWKRIKG